MSHACYPVSTCQATVHGAKKPSLENYQSKELTFEKLGSFQLVWTHEFRKFMVSNSYPVIRQN